MRYAPLFSGLRPSARHNSCPVSRSCPVTTSPPVMTISRVEPYSSSAGVVYESGDSRRAFVGRSTRQTVSPVTRSIRST